MLAESHPGTAFRSAPSSRHAARATGRAAPAGRWTLLDAPPEHRRLKTSGAVPDGVTFVQRGRRLAVLAVLGWSVAVVALLVLHVVAPQRNGPLALTLILEPYLVMSALVLTPLLLAGRRVERLLVVTVLLALALVRYGPVMVSLPPMAAADAQLRAVTWNLQAWHLLPSEATAVLASSDADLIALQELTPQVAGALAAEPDVLARFPHQVFAPETTVLGVGLLSRHPILEQETDRKSTRLNSSHLVISYAV